MTAPTFSDDDLLPGVLLDTAAQNKLVAALYQNNGPAFTEAIISLQLDPETVIRTRLRCPSFARRVELATAYQNEHLEDRAARRLSNNKNDIGHERAVAANLRVVEQRRKASKRWTPQRTATAPPASTPPTPSQSKTQQPAAPRTPATASPYRVPLTAVVAAPVRTTPRRRKPRRAAAVLCERQSE